MSYQFQIQIRPFDLWVLSMYRTYHSIIGVCNIVFGVAMILLTMRFWDQASDVVQSFLFFACLLIPVIQPLGVYIKAKAQAQMTAQGTVLGFAEDGIHVALGADKERIPWKKVRGVRRQAGIIIVYSDASHGYLLTRRVVGSQGKALYEYVRAHIAG